MESVARALSEAVVVTLLWRHLTQAARSGEIDAPSFEDISYFAKVLTERLEPRERHGSLVPGLSLGTV